MLFLGVADQPIQGQALELSSQNVADPRFIDPDLCGELLLQKPVFPPVLRDALAYLTQALSLTIAALMEKGRAHCEACFPPSGSRRLAIHRFCE